MRGHKSFTGCVVVYVIIVTLILAAIGTTGCAKGSKMAGRAEALQAMKTAGFKFDDTIMSTEYGGSESVIIVTGPMIGPKVLGGAVPPKNGSTYTQYSRVIMKREAGMWVIAEATLR